MLSKAGREPKIHPPARCLFPFPLHLVFLPAAFHPVTWGNFSSRGKAWSPSFPAIQPWPPSPQRSAIQGFHAGLAHLEDCSSSSFLPLSPMLSPLADPLLSP